MVDLKKYNYFTGEISDVGSAVSQIVNFFDLAGRNYLLFTPTKPSSSSKYHDLCLYHHLDNKIVFSSYDDFYQKINDSSNLFRVDLLVFDFWSISKNNMWQFNAEIDKVGLDSIIVAKEFQYKTGDDVNDFYIRKEYKDMRKIDTWITDKIKNQTATIESLKKSYIRDKKLEYLFGND